jgi:hypothetical protein
MNKFVHHVTLNILEIKINKKYFKTIIQEIFIIKMNNWINIKKLTQSLD